MSGKFFRASCLGLIIFALFNGQRMMPATGATVTPLPTRSIPGTSTTATPQPTEPTPAQLTRIVLDHLQPITKTNAMQVRRLAVMQGHRNGDELLAISADGNTLASLVCDKVENERCIQQGIWLWDVVNGQSVLLTSTDYVFSAIFSPDARILAYPACEVANNHCTSFRIWLWDTLNRQLIGRLMSPGFTPTLAFSPDGKILASAGCAGLDVLSDGRCAESEIRIWDVNSRQPIGQPIHPGLLGKQPYQGTFTYTIAFSPDGKTLVSADDSLINIRQWNVETGQPVGRPIYWDTETVSFLAFSPDGKTLTSVGCDHAAGNMPCPWTHWQMWGLDSGLPISQVRVDSSGNWESPDIALGPDNAILAFGREGPEKSATLGLFDVASGWMLKELEVGYGAYVWWAGYSHIYDNLLFSANGNLLVINKSWVERESERVGMIELWGIPANPECKTCF
jgi:WD40 repeat protein